VNPKVMELNKSKKVIRLHNFYGIKLFSIEVFAYLAISLVEEM